MLHAIVLTREDIREYDQRITLYTHERGLIVTHATGVKKIASKQSPRLEPGMLVYAEIVRAGSGDKLIAAEPIAHYPQMRRSYRRALVVQYVLGLAASTALPGQPDRALFDFLRIFLSVAARIPEYGVNTLCVRALWRFMSLLGYRPLEPPTGDTHTQLRAWERFATFHLERQVTVPSFIIEPNVTI